MGRSRGDAINKGALLVLVGESEIIGEAAVGCEFPGTRAITSGVLPGPRLRTQNLDRARVWNGGGTTGAEEFEACIEAAIFAKLCGREGDVNASRVSKV